MPFKVETHTTVKWESADGQPDNSRFMIFRKNGNLMSLIGTADWTDPSPDRRFCLIQECWPDDVIVGARNLLRLRGMLPEDMPKVRALILSELEVGAPSIRIGLTVGSFYHGIVDDHQKIIEGPITGFAPLD